MSVNLTHATRAIVPSDWSASALDLASIWPELISGRARIVESGAISGHRYFRLAAVRDERMPLKVQPHRVHMFERVLLGESQKVVAMECGCSASTVATAVGDCLIAMGLNRRSSRIPALLVLVLHVLHGRARPVALRVERLPNGATRVVLGDRLEPCARDLSAGEAAIVGLMVEGHTHAEIARLRRTSVRTVANQIASVYRKLGVSGRMHLLCHLIARLESSATQPNQVMSTSQSN